jgi:hypothetical protein
VNLPWEAISSSSLSLTVESRSSLPENPIFKTNDQNQHLTAGRSRRQLCACDGRAPERSAYARPRQSALTTETQIGQ